MKVKQCIDCVYFIKAKDWPVLGTCTHKGRLPRVAYSPTGYGSYCEDSRSRWILFEEE